MSSIQGTLHSGGGKISISVSGRIEGVSATLNSNNYGDVVFENYTGSYDITPLITAQRLPTENKHMTSDVVVRMIPTSEVQNSAGGVTFTIGG